MRILVTGLCSMHWGRMEYGNIGNYYIIVPLFRKLHEFYPGVEIVTTLQLTENFAKREQISILPLENYYSWQAGEVDTQIALKEYGIAEIFSQTGKLMSSTDYIDEVMKCDLVINFSGDMWGDNSVGMGANRFLVDLLKTRTAQLLGTKTAFFASSPGPVTDERDIEFARIVYREFNIVVNREGYSIKILEENGFDVSKTKSYACPAYLFGEEYYPEVVDKEKIWETEGMKKKKCKSIGLILATYSLPKGSFDDWERKDSDFIDYVELIEYIVKEKKEKVILISHSNGFELPPNFKRIHWRDYKMICRLYEILEERGNIDMQYVSRVDTLYEPWEMHALIGGLDMLISGRVHGAVAGLGQCVPTLAFDYKNGPLAHKMFGFYQVVGMEEYVIPRDDFDFIKYFDAMYENMSAIREELQRSMMAVRKKVEDGFKEIVSIV